MIILYWILITFAGIILSYFLVDLFMGMLLRSGNSTFYQRVKRIGHILEPVELDGVTTFITDGKFKILFVADLHIGGGYFSGDEDRRALNAVEHLIRSTFPDLVVVGGDIVYTSRLQSGNRDNIKSIDMLANLLESLEVYWAPVFGNHDSERADYTREQLGAHLESGRYKYCLFKSGDSEIDGVGNYLINIQNHAGAITQTLYLMDTNEYLRPRILDFKYDNIHPSQIEWYEKQIIAQNEKNDAIGAPNPDSILFIHIPFRQYEKAAAEGNIVYGRKRERICAGYDYGMFDKMAELGQTKAVFCGHDHTNDFVSEYRGIRLCYGMSIDYLAYVWTNFYNPARGATLITIENGSFESERKHFSDAKAENKARIASAESY